MLKNKFPIECPFCGNEKTRIVKGYITPLTMVVCDHCGAVVSFRGGDTEKELIKRYNRRSGKDLN